LSTRTRIPPWMRWKIPMPVIRSNAPCANPEKD
jgi:hypothetical protein